MMPFDFQVFPTVSVAFYGLTVTQVYPPFPFSTNINWDATSSCICNLSDKERDFVYSLQIDKQMVDEIEKETVNQASSPTWFHYRKGRLTASMNNQLKMKSTKTVKGLLSVAEALWKGLLKENNKILQLKLSHGKSFEPIALQRYEQYMKRINHNLHVEKSGFEI